jgi:hypothetical protein
LQGRWCKRRWNKNKENKFFFSHENGNLGRRSEKKVKIKKINFFYSKSPLLDVGGFAKQVIKKYSPKVMEYDQDLNPGFNWPQISNHRSLRSSFVHDHRKFSLVVAKKLFFSQASVPHQVPPNSTEWNSSKKSSNIPRSPNLQL